MFTYLLVQKIFIKLWLSKMYSSPLVPFEKAVFILYENLVFFFQIKINLNQM